MKLLTAEAERLFAAAHTSAVLFDRGLEGRLRAVGRDRLDLLQRMSTNELANLAIGEMRRTVLTTPIGRMVDAPWVVNRGETVLCLTGPGRAEAVRRWLSGYTFYNDKVKFEDVSGELAQFAVCGPQAGAVLNTAVRGADALAPNQFVERDDLLVLRGHPFGAAGDTVLAPREATAGLRASLAEAGVEAGGEAAYQTLRLALGEPEAGREITDEYIPLEANLWSAVSFSKGCYIGQEIIARMESRGKLARRLVGLRLAAPVSVGVEVHAGDSLAGHVTSAGVVPDLGPVALAYLKTSAAEPGARVRAGDVNGEVVEVPFIS
jgi:aminomethyltransferase